VGGDGDRGHDDGEQDHPNHRRGADGGPGSQARPNGAECGGHDCQHDRGPGPADRKPDHRKDGKQTKDAERAGIQFPAKAQRETVKGRNDGVATVWQFLPGHDRAQGKKDGVDRDGGAKDYVVQG
jgi:hypothetical protein